jgi:hypothetical protein
VLPPGEKKTQKVAVGDLTGVLQCISVKKGDISIAFKTLPNQSKVGYIEHAGYMLLHVRSLVLPLQP